MEAGDAACRGAFDAVDQGRLFAANKRARPHLDHHLQVETGSRIFDPSRPSPFGLPDGPPEPVDRQRVFGPDVDVRLLAPIA